jgi:hypothetical protein
VVAEYGKGDWRSWLSVGKTAAYYVGMMSASPKLQPVFANQDFWPEVVKRHPEFFERIGRLQEAVRNIVNPAYEALDGNQRLQMNLLILVATGTAEVVTLVGNGMGHGAMKIVRGIIENAINAEYVRRFPEQGEKYLEWRWVEFHKLYAYMNESSPDLLKQIPPEKMAADEAEYQRVKDMFRYKVQNAAGTERTVKQDSWCRDNLFQRAEKTNTAQSYKTVMPVANQILHGTISGWMREIDEESGRVEFPPTHKWGGEALIATHVALLQAVETVALALNAKANPAIEILIEDFRAIWGDVPIPEIGAAEASV